LDIPPEFPSLLEALVRVADDLEEQVLVLVLVVVPRLGLFRRDRSYRSIFVEEIREP
jgi:hypothetical protein